MLSASTDHPFSLTRGGPFYGLLRRSRLVAPDGRIRYLHLVAIAWIPILAIAIAELVFARDVEFILRDLTTHVRIVITMPLLVFAEHLLESRCRGAARHVRAEAIAERAPLEAILDRAEHLRDSRVVEGALALLVFGLGQASLWGLSRWIGAFDALDWLLAKRFTFTLASVWCIAVVLPLVQFMILRWLWRWFVWTYVLARMARSSLSLNAIHPDRAAGLRILSNPVDAFALYTGGVASVVAAAWVPKVYEHRATLETITPVFVMFVIAALVVACGPLLLFARPISRARYRDATAYHVLAREYVDEFRDKWITGRARSSEASPVLGTSDIQSLNDLIGSYNAADATRLVPFGLRAIVTVCVGALAPMVPVLLMMVPLPELATRLGKMFLGVAT